ncbi:MAG: ABC transporter ATP-binding protein [Desulfatiglandales bacterium]|jgi:peptide/nickel transport system ATP-binding protein
MEYLLQVEDLVTKFFTDDGVVTAVDHVSFSVRPGEVVGIVGESGCGKSVAALSIMRLVQDPPGKIVGGRILFQGRDLLSLKDRDMRAIRGNEIAMIFQEPMTSFNPVYTIGDQIGESIRLHQGLDRTAARAKTIEMLKLVGIPRPEAVIDEYPHRFSGGMRQRAMIAMALSCNPKLLIADEPTTALDVTIQAQILELMKELRHSINTAIVFITHDLGVIAEMAQYVVVMYAGKVVESTNVVTLFREPRHPYTIGLFNSKPRIEDERVTLDYIPGAVPNPLHMPRGCPFHPRCSSVMDICRSTEPPEATLRQGHFIRCWLSGEPPVMNPGLGEPA